MKMENWCLRVGGLGGCLDAIRLSGFKFQILLGHYDFSQ